MADDTSKTASEVLTKRLIKMGIQIHVDQRDMDKNLDPTLRALTRKLRQMSKDSIMEKEGIFGDNFFTKRVKAFTGFDLTLIKATSNMIALGRSSKELNADNQQFYKTLNPVAKLMVDMVGIFRRKRDAQKEAAEAAKKAREQEDTLDDQAKKLNMLNNLTHSTHGIAGNLGVLGEETAKAGGGFMEMIKSIDLATFAMEAFEMVATFGLAALVMAAVGLGRAFYQMAMQVVTARDEIKKFDKLFGGVGAAGIAQIGTQLQGLNNKLWGLGMSLEAVNAVVLAATTSGLNFSRAIDTTLVESVLTLSGATGAAASDVGNLYTELLKTTQIDVSSLTKMGDGLIQMNQYIHSTKTLGQISFSQLKESITDSANALGIATARGKTFTDGMIKDLTALTTLASTLSISVGGLNGEFEKAGNMILDQESGFRTLLAISGGANVNQMLTNQFDKTDAMLKGIQYLQELNKGFGNNIALTAQVAERSLGINREMAIKMINMRQDAITDMKKAQEEMSSMQTTTAKEAFEKVNSDISSMWGRVKNMFVTFFQNAFGNNSGLQGLLARVEEFLGQFRGYMEKNGWIERLRDVIGNMATWLADHLTPVLDWIGRQLDILLDPTAQNPLVTVWEYVKDMLFKNALKLGMIIGAGMLIMSNPISAAIALAVGGMLAMYSGGDEPSGPDENAGKKSHIASLRQQAGQHSSKINEITAKRAALDKWNPETVTYGKMSKDGPAGFMTVGQKQELLDDEKRDEEAARDKVQNDIKVATETMAKIMQEKKDTQPPTGVRLPDQDSPVYFNGRDISGEAMGQYTPGA